MAAADLPPLSVNQAALAIAEIFPGIGMDMASKAARAALEAGAPGMRADERARIRSLLPYNVNCCDGFGAAVADLIGEHGEHHPGPPEVIPIRPKVSRRGPREARDG